MQNGLHNHAFINTIMFMLKCAQYTRAAALHLAEFGLVFVHQPFLVLFELLHSLRQRIHLRRDGTAT